MNNQNSTHRDCILDQELKNLMLGRQGNFADQAYFLDADLVFCALIEECMHVCRCTCIAAAPAHHQRPTETFA
jgi:hypothetical protein